MKKIRQSIRYFFYNVSFFQKMVFLFCIGIVIPMIFQQAVSYLETERGIQERMLATVNDALDDKTLKIRSILSETTTLGKRYATNATLYQCLDKNLSARICLRFFARRTFLKIVDSNGQVIAALNDYANSGAMTKFDMDSKKESGRLLLSRELSNYGLSVYGIYNMDSILQNFEGSVRAGQLPPAPKGIGAC